MKHRLIRLALIGSAFLGLVRAGWAMKVAPMNLDQVIEKSEQIFTAVCESKHTDFRSGNIFTVYKLRPKEIWKGKLKTDADGTFEMDDLGGTMGDKIRITQFVEGGAAMVPGEEVLLFTQEHKTNARLEAMGIHNPYHEGNLDIVGRVFGRYSILTDQNTQQKYVVRMSLEDKGVMPNDTSVRGFLNLRQKMLQAQTAGANPRNAPVAADDLISRLHKAEEMKRKAQAPKPGQPDKRVIKPSAAVPEIANFEKLDSIRRRVVNRVQTQAAEQSKGK